MSIAVWLSHSLVRHYPATPSGKRSALTIDAALNEHFSFQVAVRNDVPLDGTPRRDEPVAITLHAQAPDGWAVRIRRVGYVPMLHRNTGTVGEELEGPGMIPGYVPDPLFDETSISLPANETHAFWLSVRPGPGARPGRHAISAILGVDGRERRAGTVTVNLHDVAIARRRGFHVANWFYNDALLDAHGCTAFDDAYWRILPKYLDNLAAHGQDVAYVPVFTPPLDGVKRPTQLLRVEREGRDGYRFDWRDVKRYVSLARASGMDTFEWSHLFTQWGARNALRIYHGQGVDERLLWDPGTEATSATYRRFLSRFLPEFQAFLKAEKLLARSFFHLSDEPHGPEHRENYRQARGLLRELAPWMDVMDALSEIEFAKAGLTDIPVPSVSTALDFLTAGIPSWCYYCCWPRGAFVQRLMDTPLAKIRMNGWLFYRWPFQGFLHWGYNYWHRSQTREMIDPFTVQDGERWPNWAYGDCFMVYPGKEGPLDSIRWEVFAEGLQDYALLQTLGVDRDSLTEIRRFDDFPKSADWLVRTRRRLLSRPGAAPARATRPKARKA